MQLEMAKKTTLNKEHLFDCWIHACRTEQNKTCRTEKNLAPFYSNKIKLDFENNHSPFFFIKFMDTWQKYFIEILFWFL